MQPVWFLLYPANWGLKQADTTVSNWRAMVQSHFKGGPVYQMTDEQYLDMLKLQTLSKREEYHFPMLVSAVVL